jgi:hypothetical protein
MGRLSRRNAPELESVIYQSPLIIFGLIVLAGCVFTAGGLSVAFVAGPRLAAAGGASTIYYTLTHGRVIWDCQAVETALYSTRKVAYQACGEGLPDWAWLELQTRIDTARSRQRGDRFLGCRGVPNADEMKAIEHTLAALAREEVPEVVNTPQGPKILADLSVLDSRGRDRFKIAIVESWGWPFTSARAIWLIEAVATPDYSYRYLVTNADSPGAGFETNVVPSLDFSFPTSPTISWPGLLGNATVGATAALLLIISYRTTVRAWRDVRGRCPHCGSLPFGGRCQECGAKNCCNSTGSSLRFLSGMTDSRNTYISGPH